MWIILLLHWDSCWPTPLSKMVEIFNDNQREADFNFKMGKKARYHCCLYGGGSNAIGLFHEF